MQIDKTYLAKNTALGLAVLGLTVSAPYVAIYVAPFMAPLLKDLAKAGLEGVKGLTPNVLWEMKNSFKPTHENENLTRLLGRAYSDAIEDILKQIANGQGNERYDKQILNVLPSIKEEIDKHLATQKSVDLIKLFPREENLTEIVIEDKKKLPLWKRMFRKDLIKGEDIDTEFLSQHDAEKYILSISDNSDEAKQLIAEEVEISLRRWFIQLNPKLKDEYSFPPSLDKYVFEKIGELIPQKINQLINEDDLQHSWQSFQRSHLQAILKQVNDMQNGLSDDDRKMLKQLGENLNKLSENNELIEKLSIGSLNILAKVGESEENIRRCIADESRKLLDWLEPKLDEILKHINSLQEVQREQMLLFYQFIESQKGANNQRIKKLDLLQSYKCVHAVESDMDWIARLEEQYYSENNDNVASSILRKWFNTNPFTFIIIKKKKDNKKVGYFDVLPLRPKVLQKFKKGEIDVSDIKETSIFKATEKESVTELYMDSIIIDLDDYAQPIALRHVLRSIPKLLMNICNPANVKTVYAIGATENGKSTLEDLGFKEIMDGKKRKDQDPLFKADFQDLYLTINKFIKKSK